jgi:hypothetical protein
MNSVSLALYRIAGIYLVVEGMLGFLELISANAAMSPESGYSLPAVVYFAQLVPILIGILIWMYSPNLAKGQEPMSSLSSESAVAIGTFLLGLYFVGNNLPHAIIEYSHYRQFSSIGQMGSIFADPKLLSFKILIGKILVGVVLILFSLKVGRVYNAIRGYGS